MSLETTIADLVSAANNLTSAVNNKMNQIDASVEAAVEGVPAEIRRQMARTVYLDQVNGSDSNDGLSPSKPVASFDRVGKDTPAGAALHVRLISDYVFDSVSSNTAFTANQVFIQPYDLNTRKRIKFFGSIDNGRYRADGFSAYRNTLLNFQYVDLELPDIPAGTASNSFIGACISTHAGADVPTPLSIRLNSVDIIVPDEENNPYRLTTGTGMVMISAEDVTAPQAWIDNGGLLTSWPSADARVLAKLIHDSNSLLPTAV